jgi:NADPH:quinone reductase-like Zn-dependent oxidoreductase
MRRIPPARTAGSSASRVVRHHRYGGPEVLTVDVVPIPVPGSGQVRVRVRAAGVNAIDWKRRRGLFAHGRAPARAGRHRHRGVGNHRRRRSRPSRLACRPGRAGPGPHQCCRDPRPGRLRQARGKPHWLGFEHAAALPVAAETASRTLRQLAVRGGQTLLIHAVAGGVGVLAAQLARARGARVVGTASPRHHVVLRKLGVEPFAYGNGLAERVRAAAPGGIDAVLDASGRGVLAVSIELAGGPDKVITIADPQAARYGVRFSTGQQSVGLREVSAEIFRWSNAAHSGCRSSGSSRCTGPPTPPAQRGRPPSWQDRARRGLS